jgi:PAS domain S-box-containing protein
MHDSSRTNQELIAENTFLKNKIKEMEISQAERRIVEKALRDHYVARYSLTGILLFASAAMYYVTGYKPEKIRGTCGFNRVYPEDRSQVQAALQEAIETGVTSKVECRALCKDGSTKWIEMTAKVIPNDQTGQLEVVAVVRDINRRKEAEEALRKSEVRYRSLFATSQDTIFIVDQKTGYFISANDAATRLYGYT